MGTTVAVKKPLYSEQGNMLNICNYSWSEQNSIMPKFTYLLVTDSIDVLQLS
jgi:hypothetical protein